MLRHPTQTPRFRELFDLKVVGVVTCLALASVISCDLVNRALDKRVFPQEATVSPQSFHPQTKATVILALRTQDAERHTCATALGAGDGRLRCENETPKRRLARSNRPVDDNLVDVLQPYQLSGNHPVLLSGVWHSPEIAYRRHLEPARERRKDQLQTFYAQCDVEFLERFSSVDVRYDFGKAWATIKDVPVGRVSHCTILKDPDAPAI